MSQNKVVLVTGSTRGLGAQAARLFAKQGHRVVVTGRASDRGSKIVADIVQAGGEAVFIRANLNEEKEARALVEQTVERFGGLDILVNNAAPNDLMADATARRMHEDSTEKFDAIVRTCLYGTFWCCKYALPVMVKKKAGVIVNISSGAAVEGFPGVPVSYAAAKAGIQALTRQIAVDYGTDMIRANSIVIGILKNELTTPMWSSPAMAAAMLRLQMIPHAGTDTDAAECILFLASDKAAYISGQEIRLDGGMTLKGPVAQDMVHAASGATD